MTAIDVQIWVGVFSASVVQQHAEETHRVGSPGHASFGDDGKNMDRFVEEASALADLAVEAHRRMDRDEEHLPTVVEGVHQ